jgi:hypothetical protein
MRMAPWQFTTLALTLALYVRHWRTTAAVKAGKSATAEMERLAVARERLR